jgi:peptidyl-prolyl cis-trans isomerase A (cyclophilin A)
MKLKIILPIVFCLIISVMALAMGRSPKLPDKINAEFQTSKGNFTCLLYGKAAPKTVANFVELAQGKKEWIHPKTGEKSKNRLYDGTIFHRVIPDFMVQGGDPLGMGIGGPGYKFEDEIDPVLDFSNPGTLAMANSGPDTNGSQFFITVAPTPWLNGKHTIFGRVTEGYEVVEAISKVETGDQDKPAEDVKLLKVIFTSE